MILLICLLAVKFFAQNLKLFHEKSFYDNFQGEKKGILINCLPITYIYIYIYTYNME